MTSVYDMIQKINNNYEGAYFDKIEGYSCLGDYRSGADKHPIQYRAITNCRFGEDEPVEGVGWSPLEALRDLIKNLDGK